MRVPKKILSIFLRIGISVILLFFYFKINKINVPDLLKNIKNADKYLLFWAFCIFTLSYILCLFRWEMLLKAVKIHLPLKRIIISFSGGIFFSLFLPSTIGGDLIRSIDLATHTKRPKEVIATVLLDRLSGYTGLVALALLSLVLGWRFVHDNKNVLFCVAIITAILIAILSVLFNRFLYSKINKFLHSPNAGRIRELIKNLHQEIHYFKHHKRVIVNNLFFSILVQAASPIAFFITALSLGIKMNIVYFFIFLPIIGAITLLPISIGGLGVRETVTTIFFVKAGMVKDLAGAMSIINSFFIFVCGAIGGLIYVLTVSHRRIQHHKSLPI